MKIKSLNVRNSFPLSPFPEDTFIVKQEPIDLSEETERLEERALQDYS